MVLVQSYRCKCGHGWSVTDAQLVVSTCPACESYPIYAFHEEPAVEEAVGAALEQLDDPDHIEAELNELGDPP